MWNTLLYLTTRYYLVLFFFQVEAEYAQTKEKISIPCNMEKDFDPSGWLGIQLAANFFFDFSGTFPFENKMQEMLREVQLHLKKMTDDNLATKVETSRRMEDDSIENNKEAGKKHKLPYIMYSQMYILNIHNSLSFSIEKEREGKISFVCVICIQRNM